MTVIYWYKFPFVYNKSIHVAALIPKPSSGYTTMKIYQRKILQHIRYCKKKKGCVLTTQ